MAYDEKLADRIRAVLSDRTDVEDRKMFGGIAFLVRGHMTVGIIGSDLMVRVGADDYGRALAEKHVRPMDFTGRPSKTMVYVDANGVRTAKALQHWIDRGVRFAETLPAKQGRSTKSSRRRAIFRSS